MSQNETARSDYWDRKIRKWAKSCYAPTRTGMLSKMRTSVDARKDEAKKLLRAHAAPGFSLVDLGCGAGQFVLEAVQELNAGPAIGRDFSPEAIRMADELRQEAGLSTDQARFEVATVGVPLPPADIVTGLGLLDWLHQDEIEALFASLRGRKFILSYSEQDNSLEEIVHRVWLVWRLKLKPGVRAYHHRKDLIFGLLEKAGITGVEQLSSRSMRFGRLIHNLREEKSADASPHRPSPPVL